MPAVDAFRAGMDIDRIRGNDDLLRALLDVDDGSIDGNLRVLATGAPVPSLDLDGNGRLGDGRIDMSDFRRFRDHLLDTESQLGVAQPGVLALDGDIANLKRDMNGNGTVDTRITLETVFQRTDFNGDGFVDRARRKVMSGGARWADAD